MITIPAEVERILVNGGTLAGSVSGGKDSDCLAIELAALRTERGWTGRFVLIHADVGRMEWHESLPHCQALAQRLNAEFVVVKHSQRDLLTAIEERMVKRPDAPPFPSSAARYCTSDYKRNPIDVWLRNHVGKEGAVCAMGLRAEESPARAKKPVLALRKNATAETLGRVVYDWNAIHHYSLADVWQTLGYTLEALALIQSQVAAHRLFKCTRAELMHYIQCVLNFTAHPAYALGNARVSCAICVLATMADHRNGAEMQPDVYEALRRIEIESGFAFQSGKSLADLFSN